MGAGTCYILFLTVFGEQEHVILFLAVCVSWNMLYCFLQCVVAGTCYIVSSSVWWLEHVILFLAVCGSWNMLYIVSYSVW